MRITKIELSVFELPSNTAHFDLAEKTLGMSRRWVQERHEPQQSEVHVLHVQTDEGIEGVCTVGDARYTTMTNHDLAMLRRLAVGEDALDRERLFDKLHTATRTMFAKPGWFGAFDNCLWDIAGKAANLPVVALLGRARASCPAYYNHRGPTVEANIEDAQGAIAAGFGAVKDHFRWDARKNRAAFAAMRAAVGDDVVLLHDAALCVYSLQEALQVGRTLQELDYGWFEEPLADRQQADLQRLCAALEIPVVAPESLMHDMTLSAQWLISGATDWIRANARHGTTAIMKLAHLAELHGARIELNGPGGLFGLVHVHLVCAIRNTSYYEYFPGGSRDERGKEIGLLNPPLPQAGQMTPPSAPGWGAEWDWDYFRRTRTAVV